MLCKRTNIEQQKHPQRKETKFLLLTGLSACGGKSFPHYLRYQRLVVSRAVLSVSSAPAPSALCNFNDAGGNSHLPALLPNVFSTSPGSYTSTVPVNTSGRGSHPNHT